MEKVKKRKIKFNFIDVLIIIIVVAALFLGYKLIIGKTTNSVQSKTKTITFTAEGKCTSKEACESIIIGSEAFNSATGEYLGIVKKAEYENEKKVEYNPVKDAFEKHDIEDKYTIYVTVESEAVETDKDFLVNGQSIKVGKQLYFKSKGFGMESYIVDISI